MRKLLSWLFLSAIIVTVMFAVGLYVLVDSSVNEPLGFGQQKTIEVKQGQSSLSLIRELSNNDIVSSPTYAKIWLKLNPDKTQIKRGYYEIANSETLASLFDKLVLGKQKQYQVTLVEGLTFLQWLQALKTAEALIYDIDDTVSLYQSLVRVSDFCKNTSQILEGCLLADTYAYNKNDKASDIIQRAYLALDSYLKEVWSKRYLDVALKTPYELLIMASIIEKETAVAAERGLISGVFNNRLMNNMRLQTDPTVIYGVGSAFDGNITRKHLRQPTPYNTYVIKGLPITPIAMSGIESLNAAAQPELTEYVYFVAKGDGTHQFSETLAQHNQAVRQYQLRREN